MVCYTNKIIQIGGDWVIFKKKEFPQKAKKGTKIFCTVTSGNFLTMNPQLAKSKGPILYTNFLCYFTWYGWNPCPSPPS